ncbi:hypothetical protein ACS0PU_005341 [Formica fusca]
MEDKTKKELLKTGEVRRGSTGSLDEMWKRKREVIEREAGEKGGEDVGEGRKGKRVQRSPVRGLEGGGVGEMEWWREMKEEWKKELKEGLKGVKEEMRKEMQKDREMIGEMLRVHERPKRGNRWDSEETDRGNG